MSDIIHTTTEALESIIGRVFDERIDAKLPSLIDDRLDAKLPKLIGAEVGAIVSDALEHIDARFNRLEKRTDQLGAKLDRVRVEIRTNNKLIDEHGARLSRLETAVFN